MILAIDTATRTASLAIHDGSVVRAEFTWDTSDHHTVELMPRIVELLQQIEVTIDQITGLGVSIGPGSFTGVRVGVAAAKGFHSGAQHTDRRREVNRYSGVCSSVEQAAARRRSARGPWTADRRDLRQKPW